MKLELLQSPSAADREAIYAGLVDYNRSRHPGTSSTLAVALREGGRVVGGLWGTCVYDWLVIELVFVPSAVRTRGFGTALLREAESLARERGCLGAWLDTFSFQARGFYEKLGYSVFGELSDHPRAGARYFLAKRFSPKPPGPATRSA